MTRRSRSSSRRTSSTYNRGSEVLGLSFVPLVDLIEREGASIGRRTPSVLLLLSQTLERNVEQARKVVAAAGALAEQQVPAERLVLAEARVADLQRQVNAAYLAAPRPWRWFTGGAPPELRHELVEAQQQLSRAREAWRSLPGTQRTVRSAAPPLDTPANARVFLERAERARIVLHTAMLPEVRQRDQDRQERERAKAAAYDRRIREDAENVKKHLRRDHPCPYCGGLLGSNAQADHINPVSLGGLSTRENMVYACQPCNGKKHASTVSEFALKYRLDRDAIEARLRALGKRV